MHFTSPCPELLEVRDELDEDLQYLVSGRGRFPVALWAAGVVLVCTRVWVLLYFTSFFFFLLFTVYWHTCALISLNLKKKKNTYGRS